MATSEEEFARSLPDFDENAIKALTKGDPRYTEEVWLREVGVIAEEEGVGFHEAIYRALVENYLDNPDNQA